LNPDAVETVGYIDLSKIYGTESRVRIEDAFEDALKRPAELHCFCRREFEGLCI
jgi:hypothetical protein